MMGFLRQTKLTGAGPADPAAPPEDAVLDSGSPLPAHGSSGPAPPTPGPLCWSLSAGDHVQVNQVLCGGVWKAVLSLSSFLPRHLVPK